MARKSTPDPLALGGGKPSTNARPSNEPLRSPVLEGSPTSPNPPLARSVGKNPSQDWQQSPSASPALAQTGPVVGGEESASWGGEGGNEKERKAGNKLGMFTKGFRSKTSLSSPSGEKAPQGFSYPTSRESESVAAEDEAGREVRKNDGSEAQYIAKTTAPSLASSEASEAAHASSSSNYSSSTVRKPKQRTFLQGVTRTKSATKEQETEAESAPELPQRPSDIPRSHTYGGSQSGSVKSTSTPQQDSMFREMQSSAKRQRSQDAQASKAKEGAASSFEGGSSVRSAATGKENTKASAKENGGGTLKNIMRTGKGAAATISKGLFGKGRTANTNEKEMPVDDLHYKLKVLNLPLQQQTRITRIAKSLEESNDKTEYWMPSLPWRAIDYLNHWGHDSEGLYRVPGSHLEVKKYERKFDTEFDVDLFAVDDLYDINTVGSCFKNWLRELPEPMLPKDAQARIAEHYDPDYTDPPQILIDEISNLPPYNYYLLFAVTCHLSQLQAHSEKNKMTYQNLCICFLPCLKLERNCFEYLVCHWEKCFKGCKTEEYYLEHERMLADNGWPPSSAEGRSSVAVESYDERPLSSSDSSKPPSMATPHRNGNGKVSKDSSPRPAFTKIFDQENDEGSQYGARSDNASAFGSDNGYDTRETVLMSHDDRTPRRASDLKQISPLPPMSPIKLSTDRGYTS